MGLLKLKNGLRIVPIVVVVLAVGWLALAGRADARVISLGIESGTVAPGQTTTVAVIATSTDPGIAAFTIDVTYDGALADATACTATAGACSIDKIADDTVRLAGAALGGLSGDSTLGTITFVAGQTKGTAALTVTIVGLADPSGTTILLAPFDGVINIVDYAVGDVDCDGAVDAVDSLKELQYVAGLDVNQSEGCPDIGSPGATVFGDVDCDGDVDATDSLKIQRFLTGLPVSQVEPCPDLGSVPSAGGESGG